MIDERKSMYRECIEHASRMHRSRASVEFYKNRKKGRKKRGGGGIVRTISASIRDKRMDGGRGRRLSHENRFFSRAAKKRRGRGLDFICVNSSWRKIGCAERDQSVGRNGDSPRRGTPLERVARIFPDCTTTAVVCGYVNRSQSKYICTHRCARCTLRRP